MNALTRASVKRTLAQKPPITPERVEKIRRILEGARRA
ncbi:hypothetical protein AESSP_00379 [Aestuariimicrobium sp. T2.26MG-19.2B]|nr:hypothetical protein AESSP_00379 [Aestuariimicrobium sp. T2.26MG-19.2B]